MSGLWHRLAVNIGHKVALKLQHGRKKLKEKVAVKSNHKWAKHRYSRAMIVPQTAILYGLTVG